MLRGVPGIYLPSMVGHRNDVEAVFRENSRRSINRSRIVESQLFRLIRNEEAMAARVARAYLHLLEVRVAEPAFHPNAPQQVLDLGPSVFAVVRAAIEGDSAVLCLINVSDDEVAFRIDLAQAGLAAGKMVDLVSAEPIEAGSGHLELKLGPYAVQLLKGDRA